MKTTNPWLYIGLPSLVIVFPFIWVPIAGDDRMLKGESGIVEISTFIFLVIAIGYCISSLKLASRQLLSTRLKAWVVLLILGAAYFALEEISYGQHMFGWDTADSWKELNDQDETNLHNVHSLFDQVPRALLTLGIFVGGIIMPLYWQIRGIVRRESDRFYWQWPTTDCVTIGLFVILIRPVLSVFEVDIINTGETKENLFALFILLYCISLRSRLRLRLEDKGEA